MKLLPVLARLGAAAVAAAVVFQPAVAAAHEGEGQFAVEAEEPADGGVRYVVRLTWVNDNHPAIDATVTATPIDPAGTAGTPVAFTAVDQDGRYQGAVPLATPGTWTVRFTAVTPAATTEVTREVTAPTTTAAPTTTEPAERPTTTTEAAAPVSDTDGGDDGDDGGSAGTIVFAVVVAALLLGGALAYRRARARPAP